MRIGRVAIVFPSAVVAVIVLWSFAGARRVVPAPAPVTAAPPMNDARMAQINRAITAADCKAIDEKLVSFGNRAGVNEAVSTDTRGPVPARKWLASQYQAISDANGSRLKVSIDTFDVPVAQRIPKPQTMSNVVAILPGTDPNDNRIFVVSGHYDSIPADFTQDAPGANDDASGTIVSLESARALAGMQFPATIEFLAVEGEEQGDIGSTHAADTAKAAGQNIAGMLDDDIVGGDQTPGHENTDKVRVFSPGITPDMTPQEIAQIASTGAENDSPSRELARYSSLVAARYLPNFHVVLEYRQDRFNRGGDQAPFLKNGYAAVRFSEFNENSNHQHLAVSERDGVELGDRLKWVGFGYLANVARVNALTLASLAASPQTPERATFRAGQAIGNQITWSGVKNAASYMLLYRETWEAQWHERPAPATPAPAGTSMNGPAASGFYSGVRTPAQTQQQAQAAAAVPEPTGPIYRIDIPESGDNFIFAVASVDANGNESLPRLATGAGRGGAAGGAAGRGRGGQR